MAVKGGTEEAEVGVGGLGGGDCVVGRARVRSDKSIMVRGKEAFMSRDVKITDAPPSLKSQAGKV